LLSGSSDADDLLERLKRQNVRASGTLTHAKKVHDWLAVSVPAFGLSRFPETDGLFVVGDSAAFVDPFTGSGMLLAIESASALAECIAACGVDSDAIRTSYYDSYKAKFASRLKVSGLIRHVAYDPLLARLAVIALSASARLRESLARRTRSTRPSDRL
jgi:flavin-dependent dehydrogenase